MMVIAVAGNKDVNVNDTTYSLFSPMAGRPAAWPFRDSLVKRKTMM